MPQITTWDTWYGNQSPTLSKWRQAFTNHLGIIIISSFRGLGLTSMDFMSANINMSKLERKISQWLLHPFMLSIIIVIFVFLKTDPYSAVYFINYLGFIQKIKEIKDFKTIMSIEFVEFWSQQHRLIKDWRIYAV